MTKKSLIWLLFFVSIISGCSNKNEFRVAGYIREPGKKSLFLKRVDVNVPIFVDSARISRKGSFSFKVKASTPDFYEVGYSDDDFMIILAEPGEKIKLTFKGKNLYTDYEVTGSPGTVKIKMLDSALAVTRIKADSLKLAYQKSLSEPDFKQKKDQISEEYVKLLKGQRFFNIDFILKNLKSYASIKAIYQKVDESTYVLYDSRDLQFMKLVSDTLLRYYPSSKQVKALKADFENELNRTLMNKIGEATKNIAPTNLDPTLKDKNGKTVSLSSLKGKYVLLAFWSAASSDCLAENLQLKEFYLKYQRKGFEIYQINLDADEEVWKKAVKFDELPWISTREDDPANPKNAILYNVRVLPTNYLYDKEGNIIAANIHGKNLQLRLEQIFGN